MAEHGPKPRDPKLVDDLDLGATGRYPEGYDGADDEGELRAAIVMDRAVGRLRIEFGKPIAWLSLTPAEAIAFAKLLIRKAGG